MGLASKLLPRYLKTFGLLSGIILFVKVEILKSRKIKLKEIKFAFEIRPNTTDINVFREVFLFQSYAFNSNSPHVIIDGGGNIGLTSIFMANKYPQAKIYSIEPSESNFNLLVKNINPYPNIIGIHSALWSRDTKLKIKNLNENHWSFSVEECLPDNPEGIDAISLRALMKLYQIDAVDILKLDIEGSERELFREGYDYWINQTRCIVLELHDWLISDCSKVVFKTISNYNFKTTIINGMLVFSNSDIS